jgi:hypothetical protein
MSPAMAVKLYRCSNLWVKISAHPCWKVQKALDDAGVEYEIVKGPFLRSQRSELVRLSGQRQYPVIVFEDGVVYREESKAMAERIAAGKLNEADTGATTPAAADAPPVEEPAAESEPAPAQPGAQPQPAEPRPAEPQPATYEPDSPAADSQSGSPPEG